MNIKTKLKIALFLISLIYLIISIFIFLSFYGYRQSLQKATIAQDVATMVFEAKFLVDEYILNHSERAKSQFISKQNNIKNKLDAHRAIFQGSQEEYSLSIIYDGVAAGRDVFNEIMRINESEASQFPADIIKQKESRLSSQLLVIIQNSISAAVNITEMNNKNAASSFQKVIILFLVSSLSLLVVIFMIAMIIWKNISELYKIKTKDEAILNGIGDGVVAIDRAWNIILFNKAACDISGWSQAEALGKSFRSVIKFIKESDGKENIGFIEQAMVLGEVGFMENHTVLLKKDGSEIPVGDSAAPIVSEKGQIVGAIIIFRDMTKEREAMRLKSDFAYASHQLRTPVNKALWNLEMINNGNDIEAMKEGAKIAYASMKSISKISGQLVEISEIDQGTIIVQLEPVKLTDIINKVVDRVDKDAKFRSVTIETSPILASEGIDTDQYLLEKILYEIMINAIIYNVVGGTVKLNVSIHGKDILFEIRDSGIGIPDDQQAIIFTKFFRGSNFDTTNIIGGGLGLFAAREYVKLLKGKIWFESDENIGTVFYVLLPIVSKID